MCNLIKVKEIKSQPFCSAGLKGVVRDVEGGGGVRNGGDGAENSFGPEQFDSIQFVTSLAGQRLIAATDQRTTATKLSSQQPTVHSHSPTHTSLTKQGPTVSSHTHRLVG